MDNINTWRVASVIGLVLGVIFVVLWYSDKRSHKDELAAVQAENYRLAQIVQQREAAERAYQEELQKRITQDPAYGKLPVEDYNSLWSAFDNAGVSFQRWLVNTSKGVTDYGKFLSLSLDRKIRLTQRALAAAYFTQPDGRSYYLQQQLYINAPLANAILTYK